MGWLSAWGPTSWSFKPLSLTPCVLAPTSCFFRCPCHLCSNLSYSLDCEPLAGMRCVWYLGIPRPVWWGVEGGQGVSIPSPAADTATGGAQNGRTRLRCTCRGTVNGGAGMLPRDPPLGLGHVPGGGICLFEESKIPPDNPTPWK